VVSLTASEEVVAEEQNYILTCLSYITVLGQRL